MVEVAIKKNARAKALRISVRSDGTCLVTAPKRAPKFLVQAFIASHRSWIETHVQKALARRAVRALPRRLDPVIEFATYKHAALTLAQEKIAHFNQHYGLVYHRISIRNQRTRWGSCSSKGNLSFSYRIALLSEEQADYIIVHELCHLGEMNHSPAFWKLVEETIPNYQEIRRSLRRLA